MAVRRRVRVEIRSEDCSTDRGRRGARRDRGGRGMARGLNRISPLSRTPRRSRLGDWRGGSRGFCGALADPCGYGENRSESVVGCRHNPLAAGAAIDGGYGCRNTSDESPRGSRRVVNPHTSPVCAKIAIIGGSEREPTQNSTFGAGGALAHPSRHPESARRECLIRKPL